MFPQPPVIRDRPKVAHPYWAFEDERVFGHFDFGPWRVTWRWKNLHAGAVATP